MARPKGSVKVYDNREVVGLLKPLRGLIYDAETFEQYAPAWLENCLRGASGQLSGTDRPSSYKIYSKLVLFPEIRTDLLREHLDKYGLAMNGKAYSNSYVNKWAQCLRCASEAIKYHKPDEGLVLSKRPKLNQKAFYTEEQKEHIRYLAIAGKLDELSDYVRGVQGESL